MESEKPMGRTSPAGEAVPAKSEAHLSEDQEQTARENSHLELFVRDWVMSSELTPEQKVFVANYLGSKQGAWYDYNGEDFKVVQTEVGEGVWKVTFGVYFDDYEAQRIDVQIPTGQK